VNPRRWTWLIVSAPVVLTALKLLEIPKPSKLYKHQISAKPAVFQRK